jgi:hypothetical protein
MGEKVFNLWQWNLKSVPLSGNFSFQRNKECESKFEGIFLGLQISLLNKKDIIY